MSGALRASEVAELRAEVAKLKAENVAMGDTVQRRAAEIMHLTVRGEDQRAEADALRERCARMESKTEFKLTCELTEARNLEATYRARSAFLGGRCAKLETALRDIDLCAATANDATLDDKEPIRRSLFRRIKGIAYDALTPPAS